ncbi:MAG TPA: sensor histidine kinase, partial [Pseudonocardiaceae bacterium]|nr:sensor histidine kinase [Pseudonocardiaceae bacterium]
LSSVDTAQDGESLTHQALLYRSDEEFLAGIVPFIRDGLSRGDPIHIATADRNTDRLKAALGVDARQVAFRDNSQWYRHPVRTLAAVFRTVQAAATAGHRLRMIEEPSWIARFAQESKEWARYESLVNVALASVNVTLMCTYDTRVIHPDTVVKVARTHPELVVNGGSRPNPSYADPAVFSAECDRSPLPEPPLPTVRVRFDRVDQLVTLRDFVTFHATHAGATPQRVEQFVHAIDEVVVNAIEHGGGSGVLQFWTGRQTISCEVSDTGGGLRDPLTGHLPPSRCTVRGRGLWMARQFCDLVELRTDTSGTVVRLHLNLP